MDNLRAKEFVDRLLTKEAEEQPSDNVKPEELVMELPVWFDEKQFNKGRRFYNDFCYSFTSSMLVGLVAVLAVPSILRVLVNSRRSSSLYTAYKRYVSTLLHTLSWFEHELKPGTLSWKSLYTVRSRHIRAGLSSKLKGNGTISQRDVALTMYGFIGYSMLKPDHFGITQHTDGDWEAYNHVWRVLGHMVGLEDKYNICRKTFQETLEVLQEIQDRVFTPCLTNVPEYFEHMSRVMLDGLWHINPTIDVEAIIYFTKYLSDVPGYIYTEQERLCFQKRLKKELKGESLDTGVAVTTLVCTPSVEGLPDVKPQQLYYKDFEIIETVPAYKALSLRGKYKLFMFKMYLVIYSSFLGRLYFNTNLKVAQFLMRYFPYLAFFKFGIKRSLINMFVEDPTDDNEPKPNSEYYKEKKPLPWYKEVWSFI